MAETSGSGTMTNDPQRQRQTDEHPDRLTARLDVPPPEPDWLPPHLRAWEAANIITSSRRRRSATSRTPTRSHRGRLPLSEDDCHLLVFGGILLAAGLIRLVGSNWADIPAWRRWELPLAPSSVSRPSAIESASDGVPQDRRNFPLRRRRRVRGGHHAGGADLPIPVDDPNLTLLWSYGAALAYQVLSPMIAALGIAVGYGALGNRAAEWFDRAPPAPASLAGRCSTARSAPRSGLSGTSTTGSVAVSSRWDDLSVDRRAELSVPLPDEFGWYDRGKAIRRAMPNEVWSSWWRPWS